jgi:hypothetical protein
MVNMISFLLGLINPLGKILKLIDAKVSNDTERERIRAETIQTYVNAQAQTIQAGMQNKMFWVPWSLAAIPTALWFGWGMLDSLCNGALPDVAALPPQLKAYADVVWDNLFLSGGIVAGGSMIASAIRRR